ncbi:snapalysin [Spirillospora sp. CA-294931]|uniref:snapalysin n=1 Tax=Spirillospora sp. CA-294931 TaxID=3240042 RepID=UPI003D90377C
MRTTARIATVLAAVAACGAAATLPAAAAAPAAKAEWTWTSWEKSTQDTQAERAFFAAVMADVKAQRKANPRLQVVTVRYRASQAPTFRSQIASSTRIWNSSVRNVQLQETSSGGSFYYREGNDSRGSYASTDGHGRGYIFLDYRQNQQYNSTRVTSHETGHVLGLPDHYSGPCSELMSGGGPGPSCQNATPNSTERARVDRLWANGITSVTGMASQR